MPAFPGLVDLILVVAFQLILEAAFGCNCVDPEFFSAHSGLHEFPCLVDLFLVVIFCLICAFPGPVDLFLVVVSGPSA